MEYNKICGNSSIRAELLELVEAGDPAVDIYYYSVNHLGSTAFTTDGSCSVTQGFVYAPFGVVDAIADFKRSSATPGIIRAVTNGVMSIAGSFPPWGTVASYAWGMADIGYGDKIFKQ